MGPRTAIWLGLLLAGNAALAGLPAREMGSSGQLAAVPFGPGERLVFAINFGPINAGEGVLEVKGVVNSEGHPCYEIQSKATSNRFFSAFYKVRDKVVSHIDVYNLMSRFFRKRLREGGWKQTVQFRLDQEAGKAFYGDGKELDILPGAHDILSSFYYVRTLDLQPGQDHWIRTHSSGKNYELRVVVHRRERIKVPAGEFDCIMVQPIMKGEGLFRHEGDLTIWLTDDERRLPVLLKSRIKVGAVDASLKEFQLGRPLTAAALQEGLD